MTSILDAARRSQLDGLEAMRDALASAMDTAPDTVVAQIAARLQSVLAEIEQVRKDVPMKGDRFDELANRRAARNAAADDRAPTARRRRKPSG